MMPSLSNWMAPPPPPPDLPVYPPRSRCWCCGRFVKPPPYVPFRSCDRCQVQWRDTPEGMEPAHLKNRAVELDYARTRYLKRSVEGRPWDEFDDFLDFGKYYLPSPA